MTQAIQAAQQDQRRAHHFCKLPVPALVESRDARRLERVLSNILGNAIKYSPGPIVVRIDRRDIDTVPWAIVSVADQGVGVPAAALSAVLSLSPRSECGAHCGIRDWVSGLEGDRRAARRNGGYRKRGKGWDDDHAATSHPSGSRLIRLSGEMTSRKPRSQPQETC